MTLDKISTGETVTLSKLPVGSTQAQMTRLGIGEGSLVTCILNIPLGPIVLRRGTLEVALGRKIASRIEAR